MILELLIQKDQQKKYNNAEMKSDRQTALNTRRCEYKNTTEKIYLNYYKNCFVLSVKASKLFMFFVVIKKLI